MLHMFIINPKAGSYNKNERLSKEIIDLCRKHNLDYRLTLVKQQALIEKEIAYISNELKEKLTIYSVGGDGTLNTILNNMDLSSTLSIIPSGTGNDSYRTFGDLSHSLEELILKGSPILTDIGLVNKKRFLNVSSIGFCAETNQKVERRKQTAPLPNALRYPLGALEEIAIYQDKTVTLSNIQGLKKVTIPVTFLAVCNGQYYGHGFHIAKDAKYDDGTFDIIAAQNLTKIETLAFFLKLNTAHPFESDKLHVYHSPTITIESQKDLTCNIDGEITHHKKLEFSIKPKALTLKR